MPRTRSLAWSELKIGLLTLIAVAVAADGDLPAERRGRILLAALRAAREVQRRRDAQGRRAGPRRRRRGGRRHRHGVQRRRRRGALLPDQGHAVACHRSVRGLHRLGVAAGRRRARHLAGAGRHADSRGRLRQDQAHARATGRRRRVGHAEPEGSDAAHQGHPRRQGHRRQAVHRRAAVQRDSGVRERGRDAWPPISKRVAARQASS